MNKIHTAKRTQILEMLVEGTSMRAASRIAKVSINTVTKLMVEAGEACAAYHDEAVRDVTSSKVQCDEIWAFCYAKEKNVARAKAAPRGAGDVWTWTALESDSKMILSYEVGNRSGATAIEFMDDLRSRLANRVQLTTGGHKAYLEAIEGAFGGDVDYAQFVKLYGDAPGEGEALQPSHLRWNAQAPCRRQPRRARRKHVIRRASEPHDENGDAPVHPPNQRIQQAAGKPSAHAESVFCALQFRAYPQDAEMHPGDGRWCQ